MPPILTVLLMVAVMALPPLVKSYLQDLALHLHLKKDNEYRLQPLLSNRPALQHISPFSFQNSLAHPNTEANMMSKVNDTTWEWELAWQMEEYWRDNDKTSNKLTHKKSSGKWFSTAQNSDSRCWRLMDVDWSMFSWPCDTWPTATIWWVCSTTVYPESYSWRPYSQKTRLIKARQGHRQRHFQWQQTWRQMYSEEDWYWFFYMTDHQ